MNYYKARQRIDGRWDYTCFNDGRGSPVGYCKEYREWTEQEKETYYITEEEVSHAASFKHKHHSDGHATQKEAEDCYREYLLDHQLVLNRKSSNSQHKCKICGEWTQLFATLDMRLFTLCDKHQNRESVAQIFGSVGEIWSS